MEEVININENYGKNLKEKIQVGSPSRLKGEVSIYEKSKDGKLNPLSLKNNMIVFGGREWLLRKAFGTSIDGAMSGIYDAKIIKWFAMGNGGGEPGNPLQAGSTYGYDSDLYSITRMRSDLNSGDPGYDMYASKYISPGVSQHGYYKSFANVIIREDHGNPYTDDNNNTTYPPLVAEIRIEISADDANGAAYDDLNEAALFISDSTDDDPGANWATNGGEIATLDIKQVVKDNNYAIYYLDTETLPANVTVGNYLYTTGATGEYDILQDNKLLIVDVYPGQANVRNAYIIVEKTVTVDHVYNPPTDPYPVAHIIQPEVPPYIMFSRVTFSTIRKTVDREIVFLWRIYF